MSALSRIKLEDKIKRINKSFGKDNLENIKSSEGKDMEIRYVYEKIIGRGTFGIVVLIRNTHDNCKLALKSVYQDKRYYNRELEILLEIKHPNIVNLEYFSFMEMTAEGCYLNLFLELGKVSLDHVIALKTKFREEEVYNFFMQGLSALEYLEKKNIAHRDIKPANIILFGDKLVKICDFGCAKKIQKLSYNNVYICSRYYRAPENLMLMKRYDFKIDVWAMGLTFIEMFLFKPLFQGGSNEDQLNKILSLLPVSKKFCRKYNLKNYQPQGLGGYLAPITGHKKLVYLFRKSIVFEKKKRLYASELINSQKV